MRARRMLLAGSLVATMAVAGCNGGDPEQEWLTVTDPPSPPARTPTPPAPTPTETPTVTEPPTATEEPSASSREQDLLDIAEAAQAFHDVRAAIMTGEEQPDYLTHIAAEEAHDSWFNVLRGNREAGWTQIGVSQAEVVDVEWITDDQVTVQVCVDVSEVDVVDENGTSVVEPDRLDRALREQEYRRSEDQAMYRWLITKDSGGSTPCDP